MYRDTISCHSLCHLEKEQASKKALQEAREEKRL